MSEHSNAWTDALYLRKATRLLSENPDSRKTYEAFKAKHCDNPQAGAQMLQTMADSVKLQMETGDSSQLDHAIDALGWSDENRYKYFVKAASAEERQALHEQLSYKGVFQSLSNVIGSPLGIVGVTAAAEKIQDAGFEKMGEAIHQCVTNALIQGNTILSNLAFNMAGHNVSVGGVALLGVGTLMLGRALQDAWDKGEKHGPAIYEAGIELSNKGFKIADTPRWLKNAAKSQSLEDNPLTKSGQVEFKKLVDSDEFKNFKTDDERHAAVERVKKADHEKVAKTFQELPFTAKASSQGIGYGKMVDIADALDGQAAEFANKSKSEIELAKRNITRDIAFDPEYASALKKIGVAAMGIAGDGVNAAGHGAAAVAHSVEAGLSRLKSGLARLRMDSDEPSPIPTIRKLPVA